MSADTESAGDVVNEHAWQAPAPGLREFVDSYVGYRQAGGAPALHRGLPSPSMTLIFTLAGTFETLVGGLHSAPAIISHDGRQSGIQLGLSPLGARTLLGVPAGEIADLDLSADELLGPVAGEVQDRLRCAGNWPDRFAILDEVLLARVAGSGRVAGVSAEISYAWRRLLDSGGGVPVGALAAETGWSDRYLRTRFREQIGLGPKAAARVIRFDRARHELQARAEAGRPLALAGLAASAGYFDQAHLDRDFGLLAGCSPSRWVTEEFRNFQAGAA
jgi:AraC-like DNA-binding protein